MNKKSLMYGEEPSAIRDLHEFALQLEKQIGKENVFDFTIGNPTAPIPDFVKKSIINLLKNENVHSYTSAPGDLSVRIKLADYLAKTYKTFIDGNYIFLTSGASSALAITFNALLEEDDEVVLFAPYFPEYVPFIENAKGRVVALNVEEDDYLPNPKKLEKVITKKTKAVVFNSPCNPSGAFFNQKIICKIADILKAKEIEYKHDIYLISDEPYREILFLDEEYPFVTKYYNNSIVAYSFSKSLSLAGDRIGYILLSPSMNQVNDVFTSICGSARALGHICATALYQFLIPEVLGCYSDFGVYKNNRDKLYNSLSEIGYEMVHPDGAFYLFLKALEKDAVAFSEKAKEFGLILVPSDSFGYKGYVRIAYCVKEEVIEKSIPAFEKLFARYNNGH